MKIHKLVIKNFQSHKKTKVLLHKGFNVFFGSSDSGKSAMLRAIDLCLRNKKPKVEKQGYISSWAKSTEITINNITRVKSKNSNKYIVDNEELEAIGTEIPDVLKSQLNVSDINIHHQHDGYFLLSKSPGQVGRHMNNIVNLSIIDNSIKSIKSKVLNIGREIISVRNLIKEKKQKLREYTWIPKTEVIIKKALAMERKEKEMVSTITELEQCISEIATIEEENKKLQDILTSCKDDLFELEKIEKKIVILKKRIEVYNNLIQDHIEIKNNVDKMKKLIVGLLNQLPDTCPFCKQPVDKEKWK